MTDTRPPGPSTTGFDFDWVSVEDYERYRPDYAAEAVDWLLNEAKLAAGARVVDLAAGTGKLTRLLVGAGCKVTAVEPSTAMRSKLAETVPSARALDGRAESIPLPDASVECVTVAQAFHHFQTGAALPEIHRVLRPRGTLALFWNVYEKNGGVQGELDRIIDRYIDPTCAVHAAFGAWPRAFEETRHFEPAGQRSFPTVHRLPSEHLATVMATSSDVASLPAELRDALLGEIRALARTLPELIEMAAQTRVDLYIRA
jgi:ubiquinone/menaquinone biosynthesis C-methylase UbiE